jgi:hypothetical protein
MGYRWLRIPLYSAFALSMTVAVPPTAYAQAVSRTAVNGYHDRYDDYAYDNGFNAGAREGERDARDNKAYGFKRDDAYEDADAGFRGGDKDRYKEEFRRGYEMGYDRAYRRFARGDWAPAPPVTLEAPDAYRDRTPNGYVAVPVPIYHQDVHSRIAYENGFRDGADEGRKDFERRRAFEPTRRDKYRDGDKGYEDRYGSKDEYKADYRAGFRAGYEEAYRVR